jgi:hypothetical protein
MVSDVKRGLLLARRVARYIRSLAEPQNSVAKEVGGEPYIARRATSSTSKRQRLRPDLCDLLAESIIEIRSGRLDPKIANALGYLGTSYLRALEVSDIQKRLNALESFHREEERALFQLSPRESEQKGEL